MNTILFSELSAFFLCFLRILGLFLLTPFFSQKEIFSQAKIILAALLAFFIFPLVQTNLPTVIDISYDKLIYYMFMEFFIGALIGMSAHCIFMILDLLGYFISSESGLGNAQILNPSLGMSTTLSTTLLMVSGTLLLLIFDFHHLLIRLLVESYSCFDIRDQNFMNDFLIIIINSLKKMFSLGLQFSFPFIIVGLILNISIGLINKLIPQIQIFSVMPPAQLIVGFLMLAFILPTLLEGFISIFKNLYCDLLQGRT
ncbi:MAG: flagellar biosynthetic protein FliR [Proteobacteria bacterium]|nr:flagellar biosynthetic protein FliR [Pseudomonadota bacterium]